MEFSTVLFLGMSMISLVLLMAIIVFGTRKSSEMKGLEKMLGEKTQDLESHSSELWRALKESEEEKEKILLRLQNLETIVTSEAWESINAGEDAQKIQLHLDEDKPEELNDADKAAKMVKKIRG